MGRAIRQPGYWFPAVDKALTILFSYYIKNIIFWRILTWRIECDLTNGSFEISTSPPSNENSSASESEISFGGFERGGVGRTSPSWSCWRWILSVGNDGNGKWLKSKNWNFGENLSENYLLYFFFVDFIAYRHTKKAISIKLIIEAIPAPTIKFRLASRKRSWRSNWTDEIVLSFVPCLLLAIQLK